MGGDPSPTIVAGSSQRGPGVERVYTSVRDLPGASSGRGRRGRVGGTVLALGSVSFLTDISSEMVTAVLPVYLTLALGLSPLAFGVLDGVYQGVTVLVRLLGGYVADRWNRPKATAQAGYLLSAVCKVGLIAAATPVAIGAVLAVDRTGKGLRTAPRDSLISASVPGEMLGRAFGVHRAMDTAGALLGPLLAFALLLYLPGDYDSVFITSLVVALLGCAVLWLFVRERPAHTDTSAAPRVRALLDLLRGRSLRRVALASGLLGLLTVSDGFLYLLLRDRGAVDVSYFPLLFVGTALVYLVLAVPVGELADRIGRIPVLLGGHLALLGAYVALWLTGAGTGPWLLVVVLGLLGVFYAATDGVLAAVAASATPDALRGSGIAVAQTAVAAGRLFSAVLFGLVWTTTSQSIALLAFSIAVALGVPAAWRWLRSAQDPAPVERSRRAR